MKKTELLTSSPQQTYILALTQTGKTEHLKPNIPVATSTTPNQVCGIARRTGYTSTHSNAFAIYRIKTKANNRNGRVTLPSLYVLVNDLFLDYQQWFSPEST